MKIFYDNFKKFKLLVINKKKLKKKILKLINIKLYLFLDK